MKKILHVIASPRGEKSRTLELAGTLLEKIKGDFPDAEVDTLNLFEEKLPPITDPAAQGKYALMTGGEPEGEAARVWQDIVAHIQRFLQADLVIFSSPMWNFSVPYVLKHYVDVIVQPQYLFQYTAEGPEGLAKQVKAIVLTSRGGDYSEGSPAAAMDQLNPYLRQVLHFCGVQILGWIDAQPMDGAGPEKARQALDEAKAKIETLEWD